MSDPDNLDLVDRARKAQQVVNEMGFGPPETKTVEETIDELVEQGYLERVEPEDETTPSAEYPEKEQITVTLTGNQAALIVIALMEQSKMLPVREQIEWTRLAIGLNDMIVSPQEADDGQTEPN